MKYLLWRFNLLLGSFLIHFAAFSQSTVSDSVTYFREHLARHHRPGVSAHRGSSETAPENTLATFRAVLALQVDYIEIDVRTTKDGQLVILHDGSLNRTTNGAGPVNAQPLSELNKLSAGKGFPDSFQQERIPTLEDVCRLLANWNAHHSAKTNLYVDCKDVAPEPLINNLITYDLLKDAVFYGSDQTLLALQQIAPTAKLMPALKKPEDLADKIARLHPYAFDVSWPFLTKPIVDQIHQHGVKVFSDLLDEADLPDQYLKAALIGVDVIQTDHVLKVYRTLGATTKK
ncbi:glycerophosphodiester phosphodiesterase [Spirosoma koreense]